MITNVIVTPLSGYGNLKAIASIHYHGVVLSGIKLLDRDGAMWLGMPSKKMNETWSDIYYFPEEKERARVLKAVKEKYERQLSLPNPNQGMRKE